MREKKTGDESLVDYMPIGWQCPKCGNAVAPFMAMCPYCASSAEELNESLEKEGVVRMVHGGKEDAQGMIKES